MSLIPNGSLFYNTETKRLHAGLWDEDERLLPSKELGAYTFNYVKKSDPWSNFTAWLIPGGAKNYPVQTFPTMETVNAIVNLVSAKFPTLTWTHTGDPFEPKDIRDQVNLVAMDKSGTSEKFSLGELAVNLMNHGGYALNISFTLEVKQAFGWE